MHITSIAAIAKNGVIGKNNDLPWSLPDDMKFFMNTTSGHHVVMGRKNYESIPHKFRPLPNRTNIVVTRQRNYNAPGCTIVHAIEEAIEIAKRAGEPELFIIGGAEIYSLAMPMVDRLYLTEIQAVIEGDTFFPTFDRAEWKEVSRTHHAQDDKHAHAFDIVKYERK